MIIPKYIGLHDWAASLVIDFPEDNVPLLDKFDGNWKKWGAFLVGCTSFAQQQAPSPDLGIGKNDDWKGWAMQIYLTMSDY